MIHSEERTPLHVWYVSDTSQSNTTPLPFCDLLNACFLADDRE